MSNYHWGSVPKQKGYEGLNNAAINSFNSDVVNSFVREIFQNSNDARQTDEAGKKKKLKITINYKTITADEFPNYSELYDLIQTVSQDPAHSDHHQFFKHALEAFGDKNSIKIFEYKDYNTTGLTGEDEDPKSTFNACVVSEGISNKSDDTAGGSYGIGKNSIYGFSKIRTVLYSSLSEYGEYIFQGVTKLASYKIDNIQKESRIYFGVGESFNSIRSLDRLSPQLQKLMKRNEPGLTQITVCPVQQEDWLTEFTKAILKNYWPLLHLKELEVTLSEEDIEKIKISSETLSELMSKYYRRDEYSADDNLPKGNPFDFYRCFHSTEPLEEIIPKLGQVKFYSMEIEDKKTNKIAYIRNGMVIYTDEIWGFGSINYCGVVICKEDEGNRVLRMMEPPTHDKFDPSRLNDKSESLKKKDGEKILLGIKNLVRKGLNLILDKYRKDAEDIPWLNDLLKSFSGNLGIGMGKRTGVKAEIETIERISSDKIHSISFNSLLQNSMVSQNKLPPPKRKPIPSPGAERESTHNPTGIKRKPRGGGLTDSRRREFNFRIYRNGQTSDGEVEYKIKLTSSSVLKNKTFQLFQHGDSGSAACFSILSLRDQDNNEVTFNEIENAKRDIIGYQLTRLNVPCVITMRISEPYKSSFSIIEESNKK